MKVLKMYGSAINERFVDEAVDSLRDGGIIVYPTDSMYAIGCDALNNRAVERICRMKGIDPKKQRLSVVCCDMSQAARYARISNGAFDIMRRHLPGAFTFILPASTLLPKVFKGRREVGVRIPDDAVARRLAESLGNPILTTTVDYGEKADDLDEVSAYELVSRYEREVDLLIDAGSRGLTGSTVVDLRDSTTPEILRQGLGELDF